MVSFPLQIFPEIHGNTEIIGFAVTEVKPWLAVLRLRFSSTIPQDQPAGSASPSPSSSGCRVDSCLATMLVTETKAIWACPVEENCVGLKSPSGQHWAETPDLRRYSAAA